MAVYVDAAAASSLLVTPGATAGFPGKHSFGSPSVVLNSLPASRDIRTPPRAFSSARPEMSLPVDSPSSPGPFPTTFRLPIALRTEQPFRWGTAPLLNRPSTASRAGQTAESHTACQEQS